MSIEPEKSVAPFLIAPEYVERIWGFADLRPWVDREPDGRTIGEVWLNGDDCVAAGGPWPGRSVAEIFRKYPRALLGDSAAEAASPLLIKLIFAREKLSVQVHPDDAMARKYDEPRGKTECWAVLEADADAKLALGLLPGVTVADVERGIREQTLEEMLKVIPIHKGEMIFVDAGTVHAIFPGSALLEVQQNCDLTYRLYDYGRPRALHVEKSLEALRLTTAAGKIAPRALNDRALLIDKTYFRIERLTISEPMTRTQFEGGIAGRLNYVYVAAGTGSLQTADAETLPLRAQGMVLVPASCGEFTIEPDKKLELYRIIDMAHGGGGI